MLSETEAFLGQISKRIKKDKPSNVTISYDSDKKNYSYSICGTCFVEELPLRLDYNFSRVISRSERLVDLIGDCETVFEKHPESNQLHIYLSYNS